MRAKDTLFHPDAIATIQEFPAWVRQHLGKAHCDLQLGESLSMRLSRPVPGIASGAAAVRLRDASGAFRVFYVAKLGVRILVFQAFTKKTQKTPENKLTLAQCRLEEMTP
jgi:phage-related protein